MSTRGGGRSLLRGYTFDAAQGRYRSLATGRYVSRARVLDLMEDSLAQREKTIIKHAQALANKQLGGRQYVELESLLLKRQTLQQSAIAAGGWDKLTPQDTGRAGAALKQMYKGVKSQAEDAAADKLSAAQATARAHMMLGDVQRVGLQAELAHRPTPKMGRQRIERRILDPQAAHCSDCENYAGMGWQPEGELPRPGDACQCVTGDTLIEAQSIARAYRRYYEGELVEITTALGYKLAATPNHPIATVAGWRPIGGLHEGQQIIGGGLAKRVGVGDPDVEYIPAPASQVFDTLNLTHVMERVPSIPVDFHGDGREQEVNIIRANDALAHRPETICPKDVAHLILASSSNGGMGQPCIMPSGEFRLNAGDLQFMNTSQGNASADDNSFDHSHRSVVFVSKRAERTPGVIGGDNGFRRQVCQTCSRPVGDHFLVLSHAPDRQVGVDQTASDSMAANMKGSSQTNLGLALGVAPQDFAQIVGRDENTWRPFAFWLDRIISIDRRWFAGHVYNLTTGWHYYTATGIITQNCMGACRCSLEVREIPQAEEGEWVGQQYG